MTRAVPEWIGKTPDTTIPDRVRLRVFLRDAGYCRICCRKLYTGERWECDHELPLVNGGKNKESNLRVACIWCHKDKTKKDVAEKSKTYIVRKKHYGLHKPRGRPMPGTKASGWKKKMSGEVVKRP